MNIRFRTSFTKDIRKIKSKQILRQVKTAIQAIELSQQLNEVPNLKKLKGINDYYRIRIGEFRIGLTINNNVITLIRCLNRKEIYRYFP